MKKVFLFLMTALTVFALVSCASAKVNPVVEPVAEPVVEPVAKNVADPVVVPVAVQQSTDDWWDNPPADTAEAHYEVGYAKGTTLQISRDWAKANANAALAQYVNNAIDAIVTAYVNDAGEVMENGNNMQAMQAFESLSRQRAQATLTGVTYKFHTMDNGGVYVLATLPIGPLADELKENVTEAFVKNKASVEANNMMNAAIDKYFN